MWRRPVRLKTSIQSKLAVAFVVAILLSSGAGVLVLGQLRAVSGVTQEIMAIRTQQVEILEQIRRWAAEVDVFANKRAHADDPHQIEDLTAMMIEAQGALLRARAVYERSITISSDRELAELFDLEWARYSATLERDERLMGDDPAVREGIAPPSRSALDGALMALDRLTNGARVRSSEALGRVDGVYRQALLLVGAALLGIVAAAAMAIWWLSRRVTRPILALSAAMSRVARGDETVEMPGGGERQDEIGALIEAAAGYRQALADSRDFAREAQQERARLEAAVSNMPVGLSVFDDDERLVVCNEIYVCMFGLAPELAQRGTPLDRIFVEGAICGSAIPLDIEGYREEVIESEKSGARILKLMEFEDGRVISSIIQTMQGGGWVAVHEDITERRRAEERVRYMARHDALTDLPNRVMFKEGMNRALDLIENGSQVAVMCIDLDHFKRVNDTLGHPVGDKLLRQVADRLRNCLREGDMVARLGGDEFAVIQIANEQPVAATAVARRIIQSVGEPYLVDGHDIVIGCSIGVSLAPVDGNRADVLLKNADIALYSAKGEGRGTCRFFDAELDEQIQLRRVLEMQLRRALANDELVMCYQPAVDIQNGVVIGFEALVRWNHPERGLISPTEFIPIAEEVGLIVPIGEWIMKQACIDAAAWPESLKVAVNLSPVQFRNPRLLEAIISALAVSRLPADRLEIEITEGVLLANTDTTFSVLHRLRSFGIHIAMDDFGTGYSSLSYLRKFPFDRIKIDGSFIHDLDDPTSGAAAIVRAIVGLGASLQMATTAEGVETERQFKRLRADGCDAVQGFYFGEPVPAGEVKDMADTLARRLADEYSPENGIQVRSSA